MGARQKNKLEGADNEVGYCTHGDDDDRIEMMMIGQRWERPAMNEWHDE